MRNKTRAYLDRDLKKRESHNFPTMLDALEGFVRHMRAQRYWWNDNLTRLAREVPDGPWVEDLLHAPLWVVENKSDAG